MHGVLGGVQWEVGHVLLVEKMLASCKRRAQGGVKVLLRGARQIVQGPSGIEE